ncbi:helix-turn-helix domain-containing protein [Chryseobacterium sp. LAM-KRS1]|uniref:helix-turn-helix domain-containing protein n=1 Tax=Chryseobacterium sp. LAM-KRS1 TaxID=2715754 RepID=UPI001557FA06|nr:helix-turn-helix domain-containing protein [Chryseobacterium sp. LAM-KRS1]
MALIGDLGKIIVFLFLLLSIFLITAKSKRRLPNYLFAAFLLTSVIDLSGFFVYPSGNFMQSFKSSSILLQMPLYYLYVKSACYYNFSLSKKHLVHGLPFLFFLVLFLVTQMSAQADQVFDIFTIIQYYYYIIAVFLELRIFKKLYRDNYSGNHSHIYRWLIQITVLFLIGNFFVLLRDFVKNNGSLFTYLYTFSCLFVLFMISWFVLNSLYRPNLFAGIDKDLVPLKIESGDHHEKPQQLKDLMELMETEKPYLDDSLTLQKLAEKFNMPEKQLSLLINQYAGKHFFDFINEFRIKDAQLLLKDQPQLTVLEVLYQVGFNSKSSFYTAFKKETGITPTDYRKSVV